MQMNIEDIKISDQFLDSHPSSEKMERFEKYWLLTNHQDKPIVLDKNGYLVDGYIRYLIMKRNGAKTVQTVYKGQPVALINGVHIHANGTTSQEYTWEIRRNKNWKSFLENLKVGDLVMCATKYGYSPVKVTRIQTENIEGGVKHKKVLLNKRVTIKTETK